VRFVVQDPVPNGTAELEFRLTQNRQSGVEGQVAAFGWNLWYHAGDTPAVPNLGNPGRPVYGHEAYRENGVAGPGRTQDGLTWVWTIAVKASETDGLYNKWSSWTLGLEPDDPQAACLDSYRGLINEAVGSLSGTASLKAKQ
jgi:hypothetical protein